MRKSRIGKRHVVAACCAACIAVLWLPASGSGTACEPPQSYGCESVTGEICSFLGWNFQDNAAIAWECSGSTVTQNTGCIVDLTGNCCFAPNPATCPSPVCPCPYPPVGGGS